MKTLLLGLVSFYMLVLSRTEELPEVDNNNNNNALSSLDITKRFDDLAARLNILEQELKMKQETPRIAFSAALFNDGYCGPFNTPTTLVFSNTFINLGNSYNPSTGIFTAFVKGTYYFSFTVFLNSNSKMFTSLMKNKDRVVSVWDNYSPDSNDSGSNTAIVQLEVGDNVYVKLYEERQIYDDGTGYTSFCGFLLFPS
ncbi:complement C1q-like protein 2 [Acipenser ruthenus]|uniref:complement C1q-like protein 2 n=1 Tax=Acipenser ruthenus TaxID=7906 RepID=UPI00145BAB17|nr:complement C1q-like protein 2 [Acipenser ruthenus]